MALDQAALAPRQGDPAAFVTVKKHFQTVFGLIAEHKGAVVKTIGDAVMAAFGDPLDAVTCAKAIHDRFPPGCTDSVAVLRISLNTGPCIAVRLNANIDYFGSTVNVAAKLQALAESWQIAMSKATYDAPGVAAWLRDQGIRPGAKVGLLMHNGYQTCRLFIGVMYGGYCVTPVNLLAQPSQLAYVIDHCDARIVFVSPDQVERLNEAMKEVSRPLDVVVCDPDAEDFFDAAVASDLPPVAAESDALMMYTSGTTGKPKGVVLANRAVIAALAAALQQRPPA